MILAHIAGLPVEEAILGFTAVGTGALAHWARCWLRGRWPARS